MERYWIYKKANYLERAILLADHPFFGELLLICIQYKQLRVSKSFEIKKIDLDYFEED